MASVLKAKNEERTSAERMANLRYQWTPHCGGRQRARNLKRLQAEALREQIDGCDWLTDTQSVPAHPAAEDRQ